MKDITSYNGLDEVVLRRLVVDEGLSDAKIGVLYGMTGEGIAYRRKKWSIVRSVEVFLPGV